MSIRVSLDPDGTIDDVHAVDALVHLEHLGGRDYSLLIVAGTEDLHLQFRATRKHKPTVYFHGLDAI